MERPSPTRAAGFIAARPRVSVDFDQRRFDGNAGRGHFYRACAAYELDRGCASDFHILGRQAIFSGRGFDGDIA